MVPFSSAVGERASQVRLKARPKTAGEGLNRRAPILSFPEADIIDALGGCLILGDETLYWLVPTVVARMASADSWRSDVASVRHGVHEWWTVEAQQIYKSQGGGGAVALA
jgi:hypothetical protein